MANRPEKRGQLVAAALAALAVATLAGGAFTGREALVEWWWIRKLRSPEAADRAAAAEKLVALKSLRAVPHLIEAVRRDGTEEVRRSLIGVYPSARSKSRRHDILTVRAATPLLLALWNLGDPAVPPLRAALEEEKKAAGGSPGRMVKLLEELLDRSASPLTPMKEQSLQRSN